MFQRLTILVPFLFVGCTHVVSHTVTGSGKRAVETRNLGPFTAVDASGAFELEVTSGAAETEVVVEGDDNILPHFVTEVSGSELQLHLESGSYNPKTPLVVRVSVPALERIDVSGAIQVDATGLSGANFEAGLSGASNLEIAGKVDRARLKSSGACNFDSYDLDATRVELQLSGASKAGVSASGSLDVEASGACQVRYRGKPQLKVSTSGASSVSPE